MEELILSDIEFKNVPPKEVANLLLDQPTPYAEKVLYEMFKRLGKHKARFCGPLAPVVLHDDCAMQYITQGWNDGVKEVRGA